MNTELVEGDNQSNPDKRIGAFFRSRHAVVITVVVLGLLLRVWSAWQLPVDFDEPVYVQGAYDYAELISSGDWDGVIDYPENREHPPLVRLLYSIPILLSGNQLEWSQALLFSRIISVLFGTLAVLALALVDPLAGALVAVQTLIVKYTSQAYLEALPLFASLLAVSSLVLSNKQRDRWYWISAAALGLTAAGKFSYFPILVVLLYLFIWEKRYPWRDLILYLAVAGLTFFLLDPALWRDPVDRLVDSILFHPAYAGGEHVLSVGYAWYQPFLWVARSWAYEWHPGVFFYFGLDGLIFILALGGVRYEWRQRRWVVVWIASSMLLLLFWPTKWPQYTLVVLPAFCLSASAAIPRLVRWLREQEDYYGWFEKMLPRPTRVMWIALSLFVAVLVIGWLANTIIVGINNAGWTNIHAENSLLTSDTVHDITRGPDGSMIVATNRGVVRWVPDAEDGTLGDWELLDISASDLMDNRVLSVAVDREGGTWYGTRSGLAVYDGLSWNTFRSNDLGVNGEEVYDITIGSDGRVWIGTDGGAAVYNGGMWIAYTPEASGLLDGQVFSVEVQPNPGGGDIIWFGSHLGVSRLDTSTGEWHEITPKNSGLGRGGIADILHDSSGHVWFATLGGGLSVWDGSSLSHFRVSNSELPYNSVQKITETDPGIFWIATSIPSSPGGLVSKFDGTTWKTYYPNRSGYTGSETVTIMTDAQGRIWFGTLSAGIDIFEPKD